MVQVGKMRHLTCLGAVMSALEAADGEAGAGESSRTQPPRSGSSAELETAAGPSWLQGREQGEGLWQQKLKLSSARGLSCCRGSLSVLCCRAGLCWGLLPQLWALNVSHQCNDIEQGTGIK